MNTNTFLKTLRNNQNKELLFEYAPDKFIGANYHITEVKNLQISSVDCGGSSNAWEETIVQVWENPLELGKRSYMTTDKAVKIFDRVHNIRPLLLDTIIKIEYGNSTFHTANLVIQSVAVNDKSVIVKLHNDATQCKANDQCCKSEKEDVAICC